MKTVYIKQSLDRGADTKIFRAYGYLGRGPHTSLDVSASTTGNIEVGVIRCAAKAFVKYEEPKSTAAKVETRVTITLVEDRLWRAELAPKLKL